MKPDFVRAVKAPVMRLVVIEVVVPVKTDDFERSLSDCLDELNSYACAAVVEDSFIVENEKDANVILRKREVS